MKTIQGGATQFNARDIALAFGMKPPTKCAECPHGSRQHRVVGGDSFAMGSCRAPDRRTKTGSCTCQQFVEPQKPSAQERAAVDEGSLALLEVIVGMPIGSSQTPEGQAWLNDQIASTASPVKGS